MEFERTTARRISSGRQSADESASKEGWVKMEYEHLLTEIGDDYVAKVSLNRPEHLNAFNTRMARSLDRALRDLEADSHVRVVILAGAGKAFCAGIDVKEFFGKTPMEYQAWVECMERPLVTMSGMSKPVIVEANGVAAANGAGLVAAADLCVAADNARMGLTAINVGLSCLGPVIPVRRIVGRKRALELLLFGDLVGAEQALAMGMVNKVVPVAVLETETRRWAAQLAERSPVAVQISKKAFYACEDLEYHKAFDYMNEAFARLCTTQDAEEGIRAFLEKRPPAWKGR